MELFTPELGLIFWMFLSFALLFLALWKFAWPVIIKGLEGRADEINRGVEYAQNAKAQLDHAREEAEKYINDARRQQAEILREADRMKTQIIEDAREAAQKEAQKVMDAAKLSIEQSRKEAEQSFRNEVSAFAIDIATKVVRNQLSDKKAQASLVNSLLDEIENKN